MRVSHVWGERISESGVLRIKLSGDIVLGDAGVVGREVVALEAEGADPDLCGEIDTAKGVQRGDAGLAAERGVRKRRNFWVRADRGD